MNKLKLFIISLFFCGYTFSQSKTDIALYNISLGSFVGGIGAVINKKTNEKTGKVFLKGFLQGAAGGYLVYESKNFISNIPKYDKLEYAWGAKVINSMGVSIIENASLNRDFWEQWNINIGFNRIEFHTQDKFKVKYKIMPVALILTGIFAYGNKFEFEKTIKTGEIIFSRINNNEILGTNYGKLILIDRNNLNQSGTIAHEIIHSYQYDDYNFFNSFINKPLNDLFTKSKTLNYLNKFMYFDLQGPLLRGLYLIEEDQNNYYNNFFEYEAAFFSNTLRFSNL